MPSGPCSSGRCAYSGQRGVGAEAGGAGGLEHEQLLGGVGEVVLAAHHVRDPCVEIVDRDGEVVEHRAVGAGDHRVVQMDVLEAGVAADHVVDDRGALVGHAQAHRPLRLGLAAEAALGPVQLLVGLHVIGGRARAVGVAARKERGERLLVALGALGLEDRPLVPVELQPAQRVEDLLDVLGRGALAVGVLDAQHQRARRCRAPAAS